MDSLIAAYTIDAAGNGSAVFFFDGIETTGTEYDAIQIAALDRFINGEVEG